MAANCSYGWTRMCHTFLHQFHPNTETVLQFKFRLTSTMLIDFAGCWIIEVVCKHLFADLQPKTMITVGRERREKRRQAETQSKAAPSS